VAAAAQEDAGVSRGALLHAQIKPDIFGRMPSACVHTRLPLSGSLRPASLTLRSKAAPLLRRAR
jgi:hypothetical protein